MSRRRQRRHPRRRKGIREAIAPAVKAVAPIVNKLPPTLLLSEEGVETIERASMRLLKEHGVLIVDYPPATDTFRANGAQVKDNLIRIDEETLMHFVRQAPAKFTQLARNPANHLQFGGQNMIFAPVYGPPYVADLDRGRRSATLADFQNFVKLTFATPLLHHSGGTVVEPNDVPVTERHLDMLLTHITLSDKAFMGSVISANNARDTVAMCEILFGAEAIRENPSVLALINVSSPLRFDDRMLSSLEVYSRARQAVLVTPFLIAGAMSPASIAATLAQQNAEALFGIAYAQMLNPGTPCVYGSFLANVDMKSGAPCFGTPSNALALYAGAQIARHYGLPFRSGGNLTASRIPDAQAGYESAGTMWPTVQAGTNFVLHAAGWLDGGLIAGYEKFVLDLEICGMMARFANGIGISYEDFAWDAYDEAGPGEHFLGTQHTMRHYSSAFYQHAVFSMDNYDKWKEEGAQNTYQRANAVWKRLLKEYEPPDLDAGRAEALHDFVERRRAEIRSG